jgi:ABC-type nitrate/sulfonate/bicarbonate transport system substrate-binding protein
VRLLTLLLAVLLAACGGASEGARPSHDKPELERVRLTYATSGGGQLFARLAADNGLFQRYGLNADVSYAQSNVSMAALLAGEVQLDLTAGVDTIQAIVSGAPIKLVAYFDKHSPYGIMTVPEIKQASELKGKTVAIGKVGDTSHVAMRIGLKQLGLDADKDVKLLQTGNSPERWAALTSRQVQGAVVDVETFAKLAQAQGLNILLNMRDQPYVATAVAVQESFARANPRTLTAALRGLIDGVRFYSDEKNKSTVMAAIAKELKTSPDDPQVPASYDSVRNRLSADPYPDKEGLQVILSALKEIDGARYGSLTPEQVIDASFMDKIRAS